MREYDLSYETNLRFSSSILGVNLCDNGAFFFSLDFGPQEVLDPSLATIPFVAPSSPSTLRNNVTFIMTFSDPPIPLAHSTECEIGEIFGMTTNVDKDDTCCESSDAFMEMHDLDDTPIGIHVWDLWLQDQLVLILLTIYLLTSLIYSILALHVHCPPIPLNIIICHLLIIRIYLRGTWLTVWSP